MSAAAGPTLAVNVDVDALRFYLGIHGLQAPAVAAGDEAKDPDACWALGVPRFCDLFAEHDLRATFFIVASDLVAVSDGGAAPSAAVAAARREQVAALVAAGHEVASHSFAHDYALSHQPAATALSDLRRARAVLEAATGGRVTGFRAPGYNLSDALIAAIADSGATYSSSRFPSPPYFLAKWAVMAKSALVGRRSASITGEVGAPLRAREPYRHANGLLELPMTVIGGLRLPAIGTFFTLYGERGVRHLLPRLARQPWANLEFHAIDLVDADDDGVPAVLRDHQPDLRTPMARRRLLFQQWLGGLQPGRANHTLAEIAGAA